MNGHSWSMFYLCILMYHEHSRQCLKLFFICGDWSFFLCFGTGDKPAFFSRITLKGSACISNFRLAIPEFPTIFSFFISINVSKKRINSYLISPCLLFCLSLRCFIIESISWDEPAPQLIIDLIVFSTGASTGKTYLPLTWQMLPDVGLWPVAMNTVKLPSECESVINAET